MALRSRPATIDDVRAFYPGFTCSFRAWVCEMDGEAVGIIGMSLARPAYSIFCQFGEALRPHLRSLTVLRLLKWLKGVVSAVRAPVLAIRQRDERQAVHILKKLGFRFLILLDGDAVYIFEGAA